MRWPKTHLDDRINRVNPVALCHYSSYGTEEKVSTVAQDKQFPDANKNIKRFNARLPSALIREEAGIAKKLRKPRYSAFEALEQLYDLLDRHFEHAKGLIACAQGCAYCCHSEVAISQLEADYIAAMTGTPTNRPTEEPTKSEPFTDPARPCPFLGADNACSIYTLRPMVCRTHVNFEPTNIKCHFDTPPDEPMPLLDRGNSFPSAMRAYSEMVDRQGGHFADIRKFFGFQRIVGIASVIQTSNVTK